MADARSAKGAKRRKDDHDEVNDEHEEDQVRMMPL
jgi:hypothetical protein